MVNCHEVCEILFFLHFLHDKYRKLYECKYILWYMGTSDVFKFLKIARAAGECNLRTLKPHESFNQLQYYFRERIGKALY